MHELLRIDLCPRKVWGGHSFPCDDVRQNALVTAQQKLPAFLASRDQCLWLMSATKRSRFGHQTVPLLSAQSSEVASCDFSAEQISLSLSIYLSIYREDC